MHNGGEDYTLDSSPLLGLGFAIFLVLFNKGVTVSPSKT